MTEDEFSLKYFVWYSQVGKDFLYDSVPRKILMVLGSTEEIFLVLEDADSNIRCVDVSELSPDYNDPLQ